MASERFNPPRHLKRVDRKEKTRNLWKKDIFGRNDDPLPKTGTEQNIKTMRLLHGKTFFGKNDPLPIPTVGS